MLAPAAHRVSSDDRPLFRGGRMAPPLRPPIALSPDSGSCASTPRVEERHALRSLSSIMVLPGPKEPSPAEAAATACSACSAHALPSMDAFLALFWLLEACGGGTIHAGAGDANPASAPDMEVADDGVVTYEWRAVIERQRSLEKAAVQRSSSSI
eukprot:TRINITY_DN22784_c0_g1_i2.p1 TRINITY_DN22784_c0_g1~~TRINITY_DN22784_c0_g1_i2.p1  ORF type:complete len:162 (+),score=17.63 TRINITY_DN22784_c0_g1_i2:24-488(+)